MSVYVSHLKRVNVREGAGAGGGSKRYALRAHHAYADDTSGRMQILNRTILVNGRGGVVYDGCC